MRRQYRAFRGIGAVDVPAVRAFRASARTDAAVVAGGRIVTENASDRHTLVDPEGNEVHIVTFHQA